MANFCKYCGSPLQDGQICSCPQAQAEAAQQAQQQQQQPQNYQQGYQQGYQAAPQPQQPSGPNPVVVAFSKLLPYLKSYVKNPLAAAQNMVAQKDVVTAAILLGIQAIVCGLTIFSCISGIISSALGAVGALGSGLGMSISANFFMCLIFGILADIVVVAIYVVLVFAVCKIQKSGCTILDVLTLAGAHSIFVTVPLIVAFILFFFAPALGALFFLLGLLAWMVLTVPAVQLLAPGADQGKFWICTIVAVLLIFLLGTWAGTSIGTQAIGHTTISANGESHTLNEMGQQIGNLDLDDLLGELF